MGIQNVCPSPSLAPRLGLLLFRLPQKLMKIRRGVRPCFATEVSGHQKPPEENTKTRIRAFSIVLGGVRFLRSKEETDWQITCAGRTRLVTPTFVENVHFHINCRLSVRPLGHPNGLNPTVPRAPFKIPYWIGAQNPFLVYFVDCPCQALIAPFIILSGSHSNAPRNCVLFNLP